MSSTSDIGSSNNNSSSVEKCTPNTVRHIQITFVAVNFEVEKTNIGEFKSTCAILVPSINGDAVFKLGRTSEEVVSVSCYIRSEIMDDGCLLRLYLTLIGGKEETKRAEMRFPDKCATVEYKLSSFSNSAINENNRYFMKCVFRLIETSYLSEERRVSLHREFQDALKKNSKFERRLKAMSSIMGRSSLDYIFTGRETEKEISRKSLYIKRSFHYAKKLRKYFKARKESGATLPEIPIYKIICHIFRRKKSMSVTACLKYFLRANRLGLIFLKTLCTDYISANLDNDVVVDALLAAVEVEDRFLFEAASHFLMDNQQEISESPRWKKKEGEKQLELSCICHRIIQIRSSEYIWPPMLEDELYGEE